MVGMRTMMILAVLAVIGCGSVDEIDPSAPPTGAAAVICADHAPPVCRQFAASAKRMACPGANAASCGHRCAICNSYNVNTSVFDLPFSGCTQDAIVEGATVGYLCVADCGECS